MGCGADCPEDVSTTKPTAATRPTPAMSLMQGPGYDFIEESMGWFL